MQGKETLLLIDDDKDILSITRMMLEGCGFSVLTANSGRKGVNIFRENTDKIKVVLIDLIMPDMDGIEVFREMKKIRSDVKVILVSGYNNEEIKRRFCDDGFAGLIQKPYDVEYLLNKIRAI
ncbi:MAG: sensor histidine kinase response regulator, and, heme-binding [Deltaproteobacteria bacterium]|nr:sensor histidine kinase response regulator, and, heme-binding [Deltaproteobacteria bacterium]